MFGSEPEDGDEGSIASLSVISISSKPESSPLTKISLPVLFIENRDRNQDKRLSLTVHLLSGTCPGDITSKVISGGTQVLLTCPWPRVLLDSQEILKAFMKKDTKAIYTPDHSRAVATGTALKNLKGDHEGVTSTFAIDLPFEVEERLAAHDGFSGLYLAKYGDVLVLHLEMVARVKSYSAVSSFGFFDVECDEKKPKIKD